MQPVVHLAFGYLCYAGYTRWRFGDSPDEIAAIVAIIGAALPDLIDKPLAMVGVVSVGRTIGHSLVFVIPLLVIIGLVARRSGRSSLGIAFAIGYLSHLVGDIPWHVLSREYDELGFLLWPLTEMPPYTGVTSLGTVGGFEVTTLWLEAGIVVAGIFLWWVDRRPGLEPIRQLVVE